MTAEKKFQRIGTVTRCKPVTLIHQAVLEAICLAAEKAIIGIGSSNVYDARNPFTAEESEEMIRLALEGLDNYEIVSVIDYGNGPKWTDHALKLFGPLDAFVTANSYVKQLLEPHYKIIHPAELLPESRRHALSGTVVREAMAMGLPWQPMVPEPVAKYLESSGLAERFKKEFGLATIALMGQHALEPRGESYG